MSIHIIRELATPEQIDSMLEAHVDFIKLAVDVRRRIVAGGGKMHADCEAVLLAEGSRQEDVWGADWRPLEGVVEFDSLINIRSRQGNRSMTIEDEALRQLVDSIVRERFEGS